MVFTEITCLLRGCKRHIYTAYKNAALLDLTAARVSKYYGALSGY
jgi:predicted transcriptional regulator